MHESVLRAWEAFYVIVGTSAGALIGLQFVVLTLITEAGVIRGTRETLSAFASPNVVHFCSGLLVSAVFSAPWPGMGGPAIAAGLFGGAGLIYSIAVLRRAMRQKDYKPVLEDWIWHAALPLAAYAALVIAGLRLTAGMLYAVAAAALLLVFIGIHNAWDTVTYVMLERTREQRARAEAAKARAATEAASASPSMQPEPPPAGTPS